MFIKYAKVTDFKFRTCAFRLENLRSSFEKDIVLWKAFYDSSNPHDEMFPKPFEGTGGLLRLVILRCIRPDKVVPAVAVSLKLFNGLFLVALLQ